MPYNLFVLHYIYAIQEYVKQHMVNTNCYFPWEEVVEHK